MLIGATTAAISSTFGQAHAATLGPVFIIAMENHNWTQPTNQFTGAQQQIYQNPAAPYINSLVTPNNANAVNVSYASNYGSLGLAVHPSEPNYIWSEAGTNFGVANDNTPYGTGGNNQTTTQHLANLLTAKGVSWKSYQEDADLVPSSGGVNTPGTNTLTSTVAAPANYTVPLTNFSGTSASYTNAYNGSHQYDYAAKHNPALFFTDTNGGNNATNTNALKSKYAPLQQLQSDLTAGTFAQYNWITPNEFNDMHTALATSFAYNNTTYTGDPEKIAQGDNFLATVVPMIKASNAFQNQNATIVIWNDETENGDTSQYTSMEIVISKLAKGNAYNSTLAYTHSSDLKTWQELFDVGGSSATGFLGAASTATDLNDLFTPGALPRAGASVIPEPATAGLLLGAGVIMLMRRRR